MFQNLVKPDYHKNVAAITLAQIQEYRQMKKKTMKWYEVEIIRTLKCKIKATDKKEIVEWFHDNDKNNSSPTPDILHTIRVKDEPMTDTQLKQKSYYKTYEEWVEWYNLLNKRNVTENREVRWLL